MSNKSLKAFSKILFVAVVLLPVAAFAQEMSAEAAIAVAKVDVKKWLGIAAGFGMAIATFGGALGQSRAASAALEGIARNPQASGQIFTPMLLGLALIESLVLFTLLAAYLVLNSAPV